MVVSAAPLRRAALAALLLLSACSQVAGDNAPLMQKQAEHLIDVNAEVLKALSLTPSNGRVSLEAEVVQRDGKTEIRIGKVVVATETPVAATPPPAPKSEAPAESNPALETVRFGPVLSGYVNTTLAPTTKIQTNASEDAPTAVTTSGTAADFVKKHPNARVRTLSTAEQAKLDWGGAARPSGTAIIFWDE